MQVQDVSSACGQPCDVLATRTHRTFACTPDSAVAHDVFQASKVFKLPSHLLCTINRIELQTVEVFTQIDLTPQLEVHNFFWESRLASRKQLEELVALPEFDFAGGHPLYTDFNRVMTCPQSCLRSMMRLSRQLGLHLL